MLYGVRWAGDNELTQTSFPNFKIPIEAQNTIEATNKLADHLRSDHCTWKIVRIAKPGEIEVGMTNLNRKFVLIPRF